MNITRENKIENDKCWWRSGKTGNLCTISGNIKWCSLSINSRFLLYNMVNIVYNNMWYTWNLPIDFKCFYPHTQKSMWYNSVIN